MVTTRVNRFPHFGQRVIRSMISSRFVSLTRNRNFCSIRTIRPKQEDTMEAARGMLAQREQPPASRGLFVRQ
jgi:hypothetical protein